MKVTQDEVQFRPVTLTINTREELDILFIALNCKDSTMKENSFGLKQFTMDGTSITLPSNHSEISYQMWKGVADLYNEAK